MRASWDPRARQRPSSAVGLNDLSPYGYIAIWRYTKLSAKADEISPFDLLPKPLEDRLLNPDAERLVVVWENLTHDPEAPPMFDSDRDFESGVNGWLRKLKLRHTAVWRGPGTGLPAYFAINAALKRISDGRLVFWDVLPGGLAERAGIIAGDVLAGIKGQDINGDEPRFQLGSTYTFSVTRNGTEKAANISLPRKGPKDRPPMTEAKPLTYSVKDRIAVLKVTSFPGAVGFDLLRDLKTALAVLTTNNAIGSFLTCGLIVAVGYRPFG